MEAPLTPSRKSMYARMHHTHNADRMCRFILYCGGTLGMKKSASGALQPEARIHAVRIGLTCTAKLPAVADGAPRGVAGAGDAYLEGAASRCRSPTSPLRQLEENDVLMDSSDMSPAEWVKIATRIGEVYHDYDGFLVIMGTDTMAYCASALSFLLENLAKPVVLTGVDAEHLLSRD